MKEEGKDQTSKSGDRLRTEGTRRIGLALGGGGAKGLSHIAFLKVFDDLKIRPAIISGVSIGAVIGAFYAAGLKAREIEEIFEGMGIRRMTGMMDFSVFSTSGIIKGKRWRNFSGAVFPFPRLRTFPSGS